MIVRSLKYPNIQVQVDGQTRRFVNGELDLPDHAALSLVQTNPNYEVKVAGPDSNKTKFNPSTWSKDYKKLIWDGPIGFSNGYGKSSMMYMEALNELLDLYVVNSRWAGSTMAHASDNLLEILDKETKALDSYYIKYFPAFEIQNNFVERYVAYTMLEASRIPQSWVDVINEQCERCIVPCVHQKEAFEDSGVKVDVAVVPLGIKPELFPYIDREVSDDLFYFGTMGSLTYRKGTDILVKAFIEGLPKKDYPDARLYIKTLPLGGVANMWFVSMEDLLKDGRIDICRDNFSPEELVSEFFAKIDCFVFPTRGEGFGLPPLEAMATGLPVIATTYSGTGDFINIDTALPLDYKMVDVPNGKLGGYPKDLQAPGQQWADPDFDQLVEYMRFAYNNRENVKGLGKKASKFAREEYDIARTSQLLIDYLDEKF